MHGNFFFKLPKDKLVGDKWVYGLANFNVLHDDVVDDDNDDDDGGDILMSI
jgi:hypothetical protein